MGLIQAAAPGHPRIRPGSTAFSALLGLLAALPTFGIDMILPSLSDTAAALHVPATAMGAAMGAYLLGLGGALLVYGPASDRLGRKPAIVCGCLLLIGGSLGCGAARTLPHFLLFRALQGIGAAGPGMAVLAMVSDLFEGEAARVRMSFVVLTINVVPMVAPTLGAGLMDLGGWRLIHAAPIAAALVALAATRHIDEPLRRASATGPAAAGILRGYGQILASRVFLGHALCNAAAAGAVFAYITGSALVFIDAFGLSPLAYGLVFGASSLSVMAGAFLNGRGAARGVSPPWVIGAGLALATVSAALLLVAALVRPPTVLPVIAAMVGVALAFGLVSPNAMHGATERNPEAAGAGSAVAVFLQMLGAAVASDLVARFFDGRSALSMAAVMLGCCLAATAAYAGLARPASRSPSRQHGKPA
ncbi:Bcr/CflA family efflux MFS transporter [Methylobacterium sp. P1-11]|uniref:Bcr/CflA family efflux MFS transporter n=1 Tax=Methylobacterium sp. P1-11 TaxID=2024616 RepID=UPI0011EE371B|nr:Bcr/CflA family efflux MFS transporter [Methylobacterium sp. P1-11]KAA0122333.1 Bcr/CflA family efflux MFS transporter [Methylobacterium sp. P1-11]